MKNIFNKLTLLLLAFVFLACSSKDDLVKDWIKVNEPAPTTPTVASAGTVDLSNYVAVGNSLTAGYADAALYPEGQENSYPNILASQFQIAGGGSFTQPDISTGNGFGAVNTDGTIRGKSYIDITTAGIKFTVGSALKLSSKKGADLNNFGVPGARAVDIVTNGYGNFNPFFGKFQSSTTTSIVADAVSAKPSFFTLWIGSNDVLGYATSGGVKGESFIPTDKQTITSATEFAASIKIALDALSANGSKGIILNVPPVTIIPFLQIVSSGKGVKVLPAGAINAATAAALNSAAAYGGYNAGLGAAVTAGVITQAEATLRTIQFTADVANAPVITDENLTDLTGISPALIKMRQAKVLPTGQADSFTLTASVALGKPQDPTDPTSKIMGISTPLPDQYTLTISEQGHAITAYATFNAIIDVEVAARDNITLVDVRPIFADVFGLSAAQATGLQLGAAAISAADGVAGINIGGVNFLALSLSSADLYQSLWSTDGVHPNARGAALIANQIIKKMNEVYKSSIPEVNLLEYPAINASY